MKNEFLIRSSSKEYKLKFNQDNGFEGEINGQPFSLDIAKTKTGFHILKNGKAFHIDVVSVNPSSKKIELKINYKYYSFDVKDKYDELLEKLGLDLQASKKINEVKAPMPGLVLEILVSPGDEVKIDQPLFILEAMKMENVIKSPTDSTVKKVEVTKGDSVEKNQILVGFN